MYATQEQALSLSLSLRCNDLSLRLSDAVLMFKHWWRCCCIVINHYGSYTVDPLTAQHYIRGHYLNTQQSEIEFRTPATRTQTHTHLLLPLCTLNQYASGSHSLFIVGGGLAEQDPLVLIHFQIESASIWPFMSQDPLQMYSMCTQAKFNTCLYVHPCVPPCQLTLLPVKWETASPHLLQNRPISV